MSPTRALRFNATMLACQPADDDACIHDSANGCFSYDGRAATAVSCDGDCPSTAYPSWVAYGTVRERCVAQRQLRFARARGECVASDSEPRPLPALDRGRFDGARRKQFAAFARLAMRCFAGAPPD